MPKVMGKYTPIAGERKQPYVPYVVGGSTPMVMKSKPYGPYVMGVSTPIVTKNELCVQCVVGVSTPMLFTFREDGCLCCFKTHFAYCVLVIDMIHFREKFILH